LGKSIHTVRKNVKGLLVASRKTGVGVNAQETEYMVMYREQNARKKSLEKCGKKFRYL
jgi:hypothetical protein